jgi:hypothetical protein
VNALSVDERAELEMLRELSRHHEDESGAAVGLSPLDRVNRIGVLATGLAALAQVFDVALSAECGITPKGLSPALYLAATVARDIGHETSALWAQVRGNGGAR